MQYLITGSNKYAFTNDQVERLCKSLGAELIGMIVDYDEDRYSMHFIDVESDKFLAEHRVREVFGDTFNLKLNL